MGDDFSLDFAAKLLFYCMSNVRTITFAITCSHDKL